MGNPVVMYYKIECSYDQAQTVLEFVQQLVSSDPLVKAEGFAVTEPEGEEKIEAMCEKIGLKDFKKIKSGKPKVFKDPEVNH